MNLWTDFATARQRRLQAEFEANNVRVVYSLADKIVGLSYIDLCHVRDRAVEARMVLSLPSWSSERRQVIAVSLGISLIFALWIGQLWLFNADSLAGVRGNLLGQPSRGGLNADIAEQSLFLLAGICSIHLAVRPRWVLLNYRRLFTHSSSQPPILKIVYAVHVVAVLIGVPWTLVKIFRTHQPWLIGWLVFFTVDLFVVLVGARAEQGLYSVVFGLRRPPGQRHHHKVVWYLFLAVSSLDQSRDSWESDIIFNRKYLEFAAKQIERDRLPLRTAGRFEFSLRRDMRSDQLRLGAAIRDHSRHLAVARNVTDYRQVCDSMRAGLLAAVERDWPTLLANSPQVTASSRIYRSLRKVTPSLALILFAVGIPVLPGVDSDVGASLRLLLLSTAFLTLMPVGDGVSTTIKDALGKALTPTSKER
ncbi:hypothetical protein [Streptomyces umbrinus]|uniref:hypothetical protein n=1 Tax=Streptomyces umbrinus TaxID=67370 RepID=UPI0033EAEC31